MPDILYTYGTLRPGKTNTITIPGALFDLGRFPGLKLGSGPGLVVCEPVEVNDWTRYDRYEGFYPEDHEGSLYIRRPLVVPYGLSGYIYEFNRPVDPITRIEGGDWLEYTQSKRGSHGRDF